MPYAPSWANMRIELPVRVIPQLYGSSYDGEQELEEEDNLRDEWSALAPSTVLNQVKRADQIGSCLSASLEMLIDGARTTPRTAGYSTFKGVRAPLSGSAQPNEDVVKFFWNQATLHHQIWGSLDRLLDFVQRDKRMFGLQAKGPPKPMFRAVVCSGIRTNPPQIRGEKIRTDISYPRFIHQMIVEMGLPVLARLDNGFIWQPEHVEVPDGWPEMNNDAGHVSFMKHRPTRHGHAVVIVGWAEREYGNQPMHHGHHPGERGIWLKIHDPAPSLQLEAYPERFYASPQHPSMDHAGHVHWVDMSDFLEHVRPERGLVSLLNRGRRMDF